MSNFERGAARRIVSSEQDKERLRSQAEAEEAQKPKRRKTPAAGSPVSVDTFDEQKKREENEAAAKQQEIREALKELESEEGRKAHTVGEKARRKARLEDEASAREHRLGQGIPSLEQFNAEGEAGVEDYEKTFGIPEAKSSELPKERAKTIRKVVKEATPSMEEQIARPVAEMHFQQKIDETKDILGQERAAQIWDEVKNMTGDGGESTRYVFEFTNLYKNAGAKETKALNSEIAALNKRYGVVESYNPILTGGKMRMTAMRSIGENRARSEMADAAARTTGLPTTRHERPTFDKQRTKQYETLIATHTPETARLSQQDMAEWHDELLKKNEELHAKLAERQTEQLSPEKPAKIAEVSDEIKANEARLARMTKYHELGAELGEQAVAYEDRASKLAKQMEGLSAQIQKAYGTTPEELRGVGGLKMVTAKVRNWFSKISGQKPLLTEWEKLNAEHENIMNLLADYQETHKPSVTGRGATRIPSKMELAQEAARREAMPRIEGNVGKSAKEYEAEIFGEESPESAQEVQAWDLHPDLPGAIDLYELVQKHADERAAELFLDQAEDYLKAANHGVDPVMRSFENVIHGLGIENEPAVKTLLTKAREAATAKVVKPKIEIRRKEARAEKKERRLEANAASLASESHPTWNEDSTIVDSKNHLYGVFDGMGGVSGGKEASRFVQGYLSSHTSELNGLGVEETKEKISELLKQADEAMKEEVKKNPNLPPGMGTTASLVKIVEDGGKRTAIIGNAGDSRVYRMSKDGKLSQLTMDDGFSSGVGGVIGGGERTNKLVQEILSRINSTDEIAELKNGLTPLFARRGLTEDHVSLIQQQIKGFAIQPAELLQMAYDRRNQIGNPLGGGKSIELKPNMYTETLEPGDQLFITSDGVHDNLKDNEIEAILSGNESVLIPEIQAVIKGETTPSGKLAKAAQIVSRMKAGRSKPDDMTAIVVG